MYVYLCMDVRIYVCVGFHSQRACLVAGSLWLTALLFCHSVLCPCCVAMNDHKAAAARVDQIKAVLEQPQNAAYVA